jgi:hypothetical protein
LKSESFDGKLRDEKGNDELLEDDDDDDDDDGNMKLMVVTPMSQLEVERTTLPPNARPIIYIVNKFNVCD